MSEARLSYCGSTLPQSSCFKFIPRKFKVWTPRTQISNRNLQLQGLKAMMEVFHRTTQQSVVFASLCLMT
ncbi:hypothetical protein Pmani_029627 [Petrolisthes manimaculis]|uniref:Uncharacterized protein n=1 Tax=Petrolisthes manimaculis TaxID=1843537 RepID=A0AAE1NYY5_9EUCA|nr:hypothetical protein Pmani_029627 [Petrolisthes manimaculis]